MLIVEILAFIESAAIYSGKNVLGSEKCDERWENLS